MALKIGDIVSYIATHHAVANGERGRICKRYGVSYFLVHFPTLGCVPVKETSLRRTTGNAPNCNVCPK